MLLPIPAFRSTYASDTLGGESALSIELLFSDTVLGKALGSRPRAVSGQLPYIIDSRKSSFAKSTEYINAAEWSAFEPLIATIESIHAGGLR